MVYAGPVGLSNAVTVKARALSGSVWSALHEAAFWPSTPQGEVRITEIMYNPPGDDSTGYEFIELRNTATNMVDLSGMAFSEGI
ncbi:MAG: lamin tail domain-containing protein, partial [Kiritimatiellaeota bacterium]|nr:lamin tail domain-containing protein [Kiritimatiellota bacterium]